MLSHFHSPTHILSWDRKSSRPQGDCNVFACFFGLSFGSVNTRAIRRFHSLVPRPAGSFDSSSKPFHKMPRIAVDAASASLLSGEVDLSTASIAQMVKENVDLEKPLA